MFMRSGTHTRFAEKLHLSAFAGGKAVVTQPAAFTFKKKEGLAGAISAALYLLRSSASSFALSETECHTDNTLQDLDLSGLPLYVIQASVALAVRMPLALCSALMT